MTELIKIEQRGGIPTVNARELHAFLEVGKVFAAWIQERIEKYGFIEGVDFVVFSESGNNPQGGRPTKEYHISVDMAKELSMVENNEKGKQARQYFIAVEKQAREAQRAMSPLDILKQQVALMEAQEKRMAETENRVAKIEAKLETSQNDFYTIAGYASLRGLKVDLTHANMLGRKAGKLSREYGYEIGKASDPRYGTVNTYHLDILANLFEEAKE